MTGAPAAPPPQPSCCVNQARAPSGRDGRGNGAMPSHATACTFRSQRCDAALLNQKEERRRLTCRTSLCVIVAAYSFMCVVYVCVHACLGVNKVQRGDAAAHARPKKWGAGVMIATGGASRIVLMFIALCWGMT